ncbi:MAG: hypothetical protein ABI921_06390, partial [Panacibacter sp.]
FAFASYKTITFILTAMVSPRTTFAAIKAPQCYAVQVSDTTMLHSITKAGNQIMIFIMVFFKSVKPYF